MPAQSELNLFRRLVGDYNTKALSDLICTTYLNDATFEVTADFVQVSTSTPVLDSPEFNQYENYTQVSPQPVKSFDELYIQFHPEVIYKAAINYWWGQASELAGRLTTTIGEASQQVSDKWAKAMSMIEALEVHYQEIQQLGVDIVIGNLSYFDKRYLERRGGQREENALTQQMNAQPGDAWYG